MGLYLEQTPPKNEGINAKTLPPRMVIETHSSRADVDIRGYPNYTVLIQDGERSARSTVSTTRQNQTVMLFLYPRLRRNNTRITYHNTLQQKRYRVYEQH